MFRQLVFVRRDYLCILRKKKLWEFSFNFPVSCIQSRFLNQGELFHDQNWPVARNRG